MQTEVDKTIAEKVKTLSPDQKEKVLEFVHTFDTQKKSIWDKLDERLSSVPEKEFAELPADASSNLSHYLYDVPKK